MKRTGTDSPSIAKPRGRSGEEPGLKISDLDSSPSTPLSFSFLTSKTEVKMMSVPYKMVPYTLFLDLDHVPFR